MSPNSLDLVYRAIDTLNAESTNTEKIIKSPDTKIYHGDEGIDSLSFVNLVVALESEVQEETGEAISIVDEKLLEARNNPFESIGVLATYLDGLLKKPS